MIDFYGTVFPILASTFFCNKKSNLLRLDQTFQLITRRLKVTNKILQAVSSILDSLVLQQKSSKEIFGQCSNMILSVKTDFHSTVT
jgi:hypothetical protein